MESQGQASPRGVPDMLVRVDGQMGERPLTRTPHSVGKGTIGTDEARVDGCDRR